jgi:hypothetical protein
VLFDSSFKALRVSWPYFCTRHRQIPTAMQEAPAKNPFPNIPNPGSRHPDHCWKQNGFLLQVPQNADPTNDCISAVDIKPLAFLQDIAKFLRVSRNITNPLRLRLTRRAEIISGSANQIHYMEALPNCRKTNNHKSTVITRMRAYDSRWSWGASEHQECLIEGLFSVSLCWR